MPAVDPREALVILLELTRELTAKRPLEESLALVTEAALRLVPANHSSVRLLDASRSTLLTRWHSRAPTLRAPMPQPPPTP